MIKSASSRLLLRDVRLGSGGPPRDVRIADGRIEAVAERGDLRPGAAEETVDAEGATVLPGLWDTHVHSVQWAVARRRIDLTSARSAREAVALVAARAGGDGVAAGDALRAGGGVSSGGGAPAGDGVVAGFGFRDALWPDAPDKALIEAAMPGRVVVLLSNDLHTAWFSPAALALVGRGDHPTGVLVEQDCYQALAALPTAPEEQLDRWVAEATTEAASRGVVGILDFEFADNLVDWPRRVRQGGVDVRVICSIRRDLLDEAVRRGARTGQILPDSGGLLEVGPLKLLADGSLNTRTAYCAEPYPGGSRGRLEIPPEELRATMAYAAENGVQPAVHAIGDLAVDVVLSAFEEVGCAGRIEHAQLVRREDLPRFARAGLVASVQPAHAPDDREIAEVQWTGRTGRAYAYADLLAAGAVLELGSDAPVAPLNPWDGIASAVARTDDEQPPWHPEQALSLTAALAASSRGRTGIAPGDPADLVLVERDPAQLTAEELRDIPVRGTLLGGRWTYRA